MNKITITVPEGIEFISEWKEYTIPKGHCIVDKGVTGCGYTEMCLRNDKDLILCSPRRLLLENKRDQHEEDENILYLENNIVNWEVDKPKLMDQISEHIFKCRTSGKPVKFMVVYDSVKYLIEHLQEHNELNNFYLVADEFMTLFTSTGVFSDKLRMYCEFLDEYAENQYILVSISHKVTDPRYKNYYNFFGTVGCRAKRFRDDLLKPEFMDDIYADNLKGEVIRTFKVNMRYSKKYVKEKLREIYQKLLLSKSPKATDLKEWFEIRAANFLENGKKVNGFEILAIR